VNLGDPITDLTKTTFGRITSTSVATTAQTTVTRDARIFQLGLKYVF
jgi:hypothetical protein